MEEAQAPVKPVQASISADSVPKKRGRPSKNTIPKNALEGSPVENELIRTSLINLIKILKHNFIVKIVKHVKTYKIIVIIVFTQFKLIKKVLKILM